MFEKDIGKKTKFEKYIAERTKLIKKKNLMMDRLTILLIFWNKLRKHKIILT